MGAGNKHPSHGHADRFDRLAKRYNRWYEKPAHRFIDRLERRSLEDFLPPASRDSLLLDVGVGTGHWVPLARHAGYLVMGLDRSASMLQSAAAEAGIRGLLIRGDALGLPIRDACLDAVLSVTTLEFIAEPGQAVDEMARCLRPGGSLVLGVLNATSFLGFRRKILRSPTFREAHFFTVGELRRMLSHIGGVKITTCAFMPPWEWLLPLGEHLERVGKALAPGLGQLIVARVAKPPR
jgi:SAM-dependent methyltransferase